jgi:pyocin large subunit-like protein
LAAWGTTLHTNTNNGTVALTETAFTNSTLSTSELNIMSGYCGFIKLIGSGYGICRSCDLTHTAYGVNPAAQTAASATPEQNAGLGADKQ